ncbi:MAG: DGQHR domain-containing protein [Alphaproteobacteria bacterium]|nr:DGQHR domain-containing protein [Alphaproteobacteria bacterium]
MSDVYLKIPAIAVSQPIGDFFLCSIPAEVLLKVAYSIPARMTRDKGMFSGILFNQRAKSKARLKQIGEYIDENNSSFPNTIILSANYLEDGSYVEDESLRWHAIKENNGFFILEIPTVERLASIIDGQHRLDGFKYISKPERLKMGIPCAVFINLPRDYQARIFAIININQKRVDKSLAYQLFGYDLNESNTDKWPPDMLGVYLARILEGKKESPFEGHIRLALLEEDDDLEVNDGRKMRLEGGAIWEVSVACIVEGVTRLISAKPSADRSALASGQINYRSELGMDTSPLRELYLGGKDKTLVELITDYFVVVDELLWNGQRERSFITRTVGVLALFDVLHDALIAGKISIENMPNGARDLFQNAQGINFADDFFHASGAGRVRIRNVLKKLVGLSSKPDSIVDDAVSRLVAARNDGE